MPESKNELIRDVDSLSWRLSVKMEEFERGQISVKELDATSNLVGKMINARKVQLEYQHLRKTFPDMPVIKWLESNTE